MDSPEASPKSLFLYKRRSFTRDNLWLLPGKRALWSLFAMIENTGGSTSGASNSLSVFFEELLCSSLS